MKTIQTLAKAELLKTYAHLPKKLLLKYIKSCLKTLTPCSCGHYVCKGYIVKL